jgi:hypothetical protein
MMKQGQPIRMAELSDLPEYDVVLQAAGNTLGKYYGPS